jgi:CheY-like chemotaxis protein
MPVMDGYDATVEIRKFIRHEQLPQPLIVACTGNEDESHIEKAWAHEIDEIVQKPANVEVLCQILSEVID